MKLELGSMACAASTLLAGCVFQHEVPDGNVGAVTPLQFCPRDTVVAAFDILAFGPCVDQGAITCEAMTPEVTISVFGAGAEPVSTSPTIRAYRGNYLFMPTESEMRVAFRSVPSQFPLIRRADDSPLWLNNNAVTIRRIEAPIVQRLTHSAYCQGGQVRYTTEAIRREPELSRSVVLTELCLAEGEMRQVELMVEPGPGPGHSERLRRCIQPGVDGVAPEVAFGGAVSVRPTQLELCNDATQARDLPPPIETIARLGCPSH